jgi:DNA-binding response OmpR family regulator
MAKRILVIDDDEDLLEMFNIILQEEGYNVILSNNGETAERVEEIVPDLVLLDIRIVGSKKSGGEICAEIKKQFRGYKLPVILVSAETDIHLIASECGADGFISKPFDVDKLLLKIKQYIT